MFYYIDGFIKDEAMLKIMDSFLSVSEQDMPKDAEMFIQKHVPYVEVEILEDFDQVIRNVLSGPACLFIDGYKECIALDCRTYPARGVDEPDKDKSLRGSRDGFVETIVFNTALMRRRIRINEMLTHAGILKDGSQFENVATFQHGELTCLLYPFDDVKLDIGKLALWRLQTHEVYGGTWLSDFVPNYLGGFIETLEALADKPDCPLIGADGNIFNLLGIASRTLREHGLKEQAKEMSDRVFVSGSYGEALCIIGEYVNITDSEPEHKNSLRQQLKATKPADPVKKQQTSKQQER